MNKRVDSNLKRMPRHKIQPRGNGNQVSQCPRCKGWGRLRVKIRETGIIKDIVCPDCNGEGK